MDQRIENSLNYIEDHLHLSFDLGRLAKMACLSKSQFHRLFKKETQKTPFQFIEEIKMNKAYQLLLHENVTIQELTTSLGYNDYETFSRAFKRTFTFSPDDIKSIFCKLKENLNGGQQEEIILTTVDAEDEEKLVEKLKEIISKMNFTEEDLKGAKIFKILKKTEKSVEKHLLIKNKYELIEDVRIWRSLISNE